MLNNALDLGITEHEFWDMTLAELNRLTESRVRQQKMKAKERATFDYIHAQLIGRAFACNMTSEATFPPIEEAYPSLFLDQEKINKQHEQQQSLSALRFMQFAESVNRKYEAKETD